MPLYLFKYTGLTNEYKITYNYPLFEDSMIREQLQLSFFTTNFDYQQYADDGMEDSFIRGVDNVIIEENYVNSQEYDYMCYVREGKYYYYFILQKFYCSDTTTRLVITKDVYQNNVFNHEIETSLVIRQHEDRFTVDNQDNLVPIYSTTYEDVPINEQMETEEIDMRNLAYNGEFSVAIKYILIISTDSISDNDTPLVIPYYTSPYYVNIIPFYEENNQPISELLVSTRFGGSSESNLIPSLDSYNINRIAKFPSVVKITEISYHHLGKPTISLLGSTLYLNFVEGTVNSFCVLSSITSTSDTVLAVRGGVGIWKEDYKSVDLPKFSLPNFGGVSQLFGNLNIDLEPKLYTRNFDFYRLTLETNEMDFFHEFLDNENLSFTYNYDQDFHLNVYAKNYKDKTNYSIITNSSIDYALINDEFFRYNLEKRALDNQRLITSIWANVGTSTVSNITRGFVNPRTINNSTNVAINSVTSVVDLYYKRKELEQMHPSISNENTTVMLNRLHPTQIQMHRIRVSENDRKSIFLFFYYYGYYCGKLLKPNINSRTYFNYIKTSDVNISGNLSTDDRLTLENIYNKGIIIKHIRSQNLSIPDFERLENFERSHL